MAIPVIDKDRKKMRVQVGSEIRRKKRSAMGGDSDGFHSSEEDEDGDASSSDPESDYLYEA